MSPSADPILEPLQRGRVERRRRPASGEGALLVLVDSSGPYHQRSLVDETVLVALEHLGLPYRMLDLAGTRPTPALLASCAGLVLAQDGLGDRLTEAETQIIAEAVRAGLGLVNLDWDLRRYAGPLLDIFGFADVGRLPFASDQFYVRDDTHYITWLQTGRRFHTAKRMVTALAVGSWRADVAPLVEMALGKDQLVYTRHLVPGNVFEPRHYPVVFAARWGQGRAVQFAVNPRVWRAAALGHLGGLGDVFWRSLLWVARKPFVANTVPPFVTMSFDDCGGRHDFAYLDICTRHGYRPLASLFIDDIQGRHLPGLRARALAGEIMVNTHAMRYYDLQLYDFGVDELPVAELERRFARDDAFYARLGAPCARTVRDHWGELGARSLPYLKARGRTTINTPVLVGEHKADQIIPPGGQGYWPYNSTLCFYDTLPHDNDFYIMGAFNERHLADFLTGATQLLREAPVNDVARAAEGAAHQIRHGLSNGFFADVLTHEQKFTVLSLEEWDQILARAAQLTNRFEKLFVTHDHVADYLRSKDRTWIAQADLAAGAARVRLAGQAEVPLQLSVYRDVDEGVERASLAVPAFTGQTSVEF